MNRLGLIASAITLGVATMAVYTVARHVGVHPGTVQHATSVSPVASVTSAGGEGVGPASAPAISDGTPWSPVPGDSRRAGAQKEADGAATASDSRREAIGHALRQLESLGEDERRDPARVAQFITELRKANGSSVMGTVNLDALICNLDIAQKMKEVTSTMTPLYPAASGVSDPERADRLKEKIRRLRSLTDQLRDVTHTDGPVDTHSCGVVADQTGHSEGRTP